MRPRSPLQWDEPNVWQIAEARAEYTAWHHALAILVGVLAGALKEHAASPSVARPEPWRTGQVADPIVRPTLGQVAQRGKLPLAPKRAAPLRPIESAIERRSRKYLNRPRRKADAGKAEGMGESGILPLG